LEAVAAEYERHRSERHTRLHLDHVPVVDEDDRRVDYLEIIGRAITAGYESVMVDGSRLPFAEKRRLHEGGRRPGHAVGVPVERELGAVLGHEPARCRRTDELFASGKGFTDSDEAAASCSHRGGLAFGSDRQHPWRDRGGNPGQGQGRGALEPSNGSRTCGTRRASRWCCTAARASARRTCWLPCVSAIAKINVATAIRQPYEAKPEPGRGRRPRGRCTGRC